MIYDVLVIIIVLVSCFIGYKRGGAKMLMSLIGTLLSYFVAAFSGEFLSTFIYDNFIRNSIIESVTDSVSKSTAGLNTAVESLPPFVRFICSIADVDIKLNDAIDSLPSTVALSVEESLHPVVLSVLTCILTVVLFIVIFFVFRVFLSKILLSVFKLPILRSLNSVAGVVFSLVSAVLLISFIAFLLRLLMPYIADVPYILSESTIYNSYIFYYFYSGNIFSNIISLF